MFAIDSAIKKSAESYLILHIFSLSSSEFLINYLFLKNIPMAYILLLDKSLFTSS